MISKRDVQLGKIALQEDMVSKEQINKCLKIKKKLKTKASLGAILLKKGYIDRDQLEIIVGIHNNKSDGKDDDEQKKSKRKSVRKDKDKDSEKTGAKDSKKDSERAERRKKRSTAKRKREKLDADADATKSGDEVKAEADATKSADEVKAKTDDGAETKKDDKEARRSKRSKSLEAKRKRRSKRLEAEKDDEKDSAEKDGDDSEKSKDDSDEKTKKRRSGRKKRRSKREDKSHDPDMGPAINKDAEDEAKQKAKDEEKDGGDPEKSDDEEEFLDPSILVSAASEVPDEQADLMANLLASTLEGPEDEHHSFESGASLISDSLLESADMTVSQEEEIVDDTGKIQKKIIACSDCGKKYRVKPKQAGKRFDCRRCDTKVRVPKDYFDAPDEDIQEVPPKKKRREKKDRKKGRTGRHSRRSKRSKTKAAKSSASIPVEEFDLGAMESDEEFEAQSKAKKESKRKSERTDKAKSAKTEKQDSIRDLAAQALKAPKASAEARKMSKGSVVQLVSFSILLVLVVGGVFGFLQYQESNRIAAIEANRKAEWEKISASLLALNSEADALLEKQAITANDADALRSMELTVQTKDDVRDTLLFPENREKAKDLSENQYKFKEKRQLLLSKAAEIFVGMNNLAMQQEAVSIYKKTLEIKKNPDVFAAYGQSLARLYQWNEALAAVQQALDIDKSNKKALLAKGYILESADAPNEAADIYELLARAEPFAGVLCARAWMNAGDKSSALKKLGEAANAEAVQSDPIKLATVQIFQAEINIRKEEYDAAENTLKEAVKTAPKFPWAHLKFGYLYLKTGQFDNAVAEFEEAQKNGGGPEAFLGLAIAHEANFDTNKAKEFYRKAAGAKSTATSLGPVIGNVVLMVDPLNPQNVRSRAKRRLGDLYRALGDFDRALREYQESRKADEWNGIALTRLARIYKKTKFDRKALSYLRRAEQMTLGYKQGNPITFEGKARRRSPATAELFVTLGMFEQQAQKYGRAGNAFEIAVKISESLNIKSTEVYTFQARLLLDRNQRKEAVRKFVSLENLETKNKIYLQGANAYKAFEKSGDVAELDKVEAAASAVLSQNENHSAALLLKAEAYAGRCGALRKKIGKPDPAKHAEEIKTIDALAKKATQFFAESIEVNPYSVKARMARGAFLTDPTGQPDFQTALEDYKAVTKLGKNSVEALYGYALCAYSLNNFTEALTAITKAINKRMNFKEGYALRANIYDRLNRPKDAEKDRRKANK